MEDFVEDTVELLAYGNAAFEAGVEAGFSGGAVALPALTTRPVTLLRWR